MPDFPLITIEAAVTQANTQGIAIANPDATPTPTKGKIRLFKDSLGTPSVETTITELEANEADYDGYPTGGFDVDEMSAPLGAPGGGVVILSPEVIAVYTTGDPNTIGGYWLENSAGDVIEVFVYDPVRTLAAIPDGWPIVAQLGFGRNSV